MRVFKFGGASIATPGRAAALLPIIQAETEPVVLVISAMGKTTNALENIVDRASRGMRDANTLAKKLEEQHLQYARELLNDTYYAAATAAIEKYFTELEKAVLGADRTRYAYWYDQVVSMGEIFSTLIFSFLLQQNGFEHEWIDARTAIYTDDTYRNAGIDWNQSRQQVQAIMGRKLKQGKSILTQGFIGCSSSGSSVTLGREGSDYTAAILAAMLQLESVTIWKDVEGLLNADPKLFPDTVKIDEITYNEVIEMAFYGAQIIHPKTIKPLQNNNIPLYVKCFLDPALKGTVIKSEANDAQYPPLIVLKSNQVLLQVTTRDFSFITEDNLSKIYAIFHALKVKINLIQNAAISFIACIDNYADIRSLTTLLGREYKVLQNENVNLLTVRHFTPKAISDLTKDKQILLRQETRKTLQVVMK